MERNLLFDRIANIGNKFFSSIRTVRYSDAHKNGENKMFDSVEVGSICNENVSVRTTTITVQDGDEEPVTNDVVVLNANDACGKEIDVVLSKQDCIELMAYLSAATFALRD